MADRKKRNMQRVWMEIGLAVLLAVGLGIGAAHLSEGQNVSHTDEQEIKKEEHKEESKESKESKENREENRKETGEETAQAESPSPIMGNSQVTEQQMAAYFKTAGVAYPAEVLGKGGADSIETFCQMYYEEAEAEGVRVEVAFAQTMKETNWLQYGGDASIEQYNFAGLGTTGGGVPGNSYPDVRTGIRAQIQHLIAYATTDILALECVDDRYEYVKKGSAPYVEWLGQKENPQGLGWATDEKYGYSIVEMIHAMEQISLK